MLLFLEKNRYTKRILNLDNRILVKGSFIMEHGIAKSIILSDKSVLAYEIFGTGFPFVLLHGNGNDRTYFANQIPFFAKHFKVIVVDSRGHGKSTGELSQLSYQLMANDLYELFQAEQLKQAYILGFSDGANVAMAFSASYPNKVTKLVLNAGNYSVSGVKLGVRILTDMQYVLVKFLALFSSHFKKRKHVVHLMVAPTGLSKGMLKKISANTLVIVGKKDIIKIEHSMAIASTIPKATFVLIPNQGHLLAKKLPNVFNEEVLHFLVGGASS